MSRADLVQLSLLLDGELSLSEVSALRERLRDEPELRQASERLQRLSSVALLPTAEDRVAASRASARLGFKAPPVRWPWILGGVLLVSVVGGLWALGPDAPQPEPSPRVVEAPMDAAVVPGSTPPAPMPVRDPPVYLLSAGGPTVQVPADGRARVKGGGAFSFAGLPLQLDGSGDVVLTVTSAPGLLDAPPGTQSTETFTAPGGETVIAFVLSGQLRLVAATKPAAESPWTALILGQRKVVRLPERAAKVEVLTPGVLSARLISGRLVELRGQREGEASIVLHAPGGKRQTREVVVTSQFDAGRRQVWLPVGDRVPLELTGIERYGVGDATIVEVQRVPDGVQLRPLRNGITTLEVWFTDGRVDRWSVWSLPMPRLVLEGLRGPFAVPVWEERLLVLAPGEDVAVDPPWRAELVRHDATQVRLAPLALGPCTLVVTDGSGRRRQVLLTFHE